MEKKLLIVFLLGWVIVGLINKTVVAALKINEIYPAPLTDEDEWVEIYNHTDEIINIKNYYLMDSSGKKIFFNEGAINPLSYTIASTSSAILNNSNQTNKDYADIVYLYNSENQIIDIATYSGTFSSEKIYGRCPDGVGDWYVLNIITKNRSNTQACTILTPTLTSTSTAILTPTTIQLLLTPILSPALTVNPTSSPLISFNKIYLSEIMVNPADNEKEWVEIYNDNDFEVNLINWFIDDIENGGSSPKSFSFKINPKSYQVLELGSSMFNNTGDSVRLLDFEKNLKDSFEYSSTIAGKSYGRISWESDEFCLQNQSKGLNNNPCIESKLSNQLILSSFGTIIPKPTLGQKINITENTKFLSKHIKNSSKNYSSWEDFLNNNSSAVLGLTSNDWLYSDRTKKNFTFAKLINFLTINYSFLSFLGIGIKVFKKFKIST